MKAFMRWVDRYCARHRNFGIRSLMKFLIIGNAVVWLFTLLDTTGTITYYLSLNPRMVLQGQIWRLATFALIPDSSGLLTLIFLYFYYFIGSVLEREWGQAKFNFYFLTGLVITILYTFLIYFITGYSMSVGATYIYLSMFFAFATFYPDQTVLLFFVIPLKIKWLALVDAAFFLLEILRTPFPYSLLPVAATLNYLLFCGDMLLDGVLPGRARAGKTVSFRREAQRIRRDTSRTAYRFKCAVCGRTENDDPNLEFRYCSRCAGYHCFCQDHINNHIHFTE